MPIVITDNPLSVVHVYYGPQHRHGTRENSPPRTNFNHSLPEFHTRDLHTRTLSTLQMTQGTPN
ncbi:hypothetical protein L484_025248 [Morus notabilis]|uniref:Uncharacterized protein n=1 Tax=Morus notabilis TaxID=981085 RepID=W9SIQ9_9ROSA|nr:hypothetical protein L484_025248 [Morus notabilis]